MPQKLTVLFLSELLLCLLFWLIDSTAGTIFSLCLSAIAAGVLLVALVADRIERSKIGRIYFLGMLVTVVAPLLSWLLSRILVHS